MKKDSFPHMHISELMINGLGLYPSHYAAYIHTVYHVPRTEYTARRNEAQLSFFICIIRIQYWAIGSFWQWAEPRGPVSVQRRSCNC